MAGKSRSIEVMMTKRVFHIPDMHCTACVMRLESLEDEVPGVKRVRASYQKQQMEVEYDETLVTQSQIAAAVAKKGYTVGPS
jgi:copper chaperone